MFSPSRAVFCIAPPRQETRLADMSVGSRCYETYSLTSSATDVGLPANFGIQQLRFCPCRTPPTRTARLGMDQDKRGGHREAISYACQHSAPCTHCYADQASRSRARAVYTGASAAVVCPASVDSVSAPSTLSAPHNAGATASQRPFLLACVGCPGAGFGSGWAGAGGRAQTPAGPVVRRPCERVRVCRSDAQITTAVEHLRCA
ncbi:hypothetical protein C8R47DRAFT_1312898, partial [Mycena vitilis]